MKSILIVLTFAAAAQSGSAGSWLEQQPLAGWNTPGGALPQAPSMPESREAVIKRCQLTPPQSTGAEKALAAAGWIPFWNVDRQLIRDDIEIVGGMASADSACQPATYNLFVFVGGQFAGTLAPEPMTTGRDGAAGAVRLQPQIVSAEFSRYANSDTPCCPSSRVTVRYQIERGNKGATVKPVDVRTTRP